MAGFCHKLSCEAHHEQTFKQFVEIVHVYMQMYACTTVIFPQTTYSRYDLVKHILTSYLANKEGHRTICSVKYLFGGYIVLANNFDYIIYPLENSGIEFEKSIYIDTYFSFLGLS